MVEGKSGPAPRQVFISYSHLDFSRVDEIVTGLDKSGVSYWMDRKEIEGGMNYGPEVVEAISRCKVFLLMSSDASLRSLEVKAEIQLAWKYRRPMLPVLLDATSYPRQVEYWLTGWQWIDVKSLPAEEWRPAILRALSRSGVDCGEPASESAPESRRLGRDLEGLRSLARFTDQIWPVVPEAARRIAVSSGTRGLGAPQPDVQHGYRLGDRLCVAIEAEQEGHLLLLDEGPENVVYCLCPSWFAPDTRLRSGVNTLPQPGSRFDSFLLTGVPGREHLLAVVTNEPLDLGWMPPDARTPSRVVSSSDVEELLGRLEQLEGNRWTALSTYFDITP